MLKNFPPFTKCISKLNNIQVDDAQETQVVMPIYNLIEYSDNSSKTCGGSWQYYRDEPNVTLANSESTKFKVKIVAKTSAGGNTRDFKMKVPLKYLSNFWRTCKMPLINCEVNLVLTWPSTCVINN